MTWQIQFDPSQPWLEWFHKIPVERAAWDFARGLDLCPMFGGVDCPPAFDPEQVLGLGEFPYLQFVVTDFFSRHFISADYITIWDSTMLLVTFGQPFDLMRVAEPPMWALLALLALLRLR